MFFTITLLLNESAVADNLLDVYFLFKRKMSFGAFERRSLNSFSNNNLASVYNF